RQVLTRRIPLQDGRKLASLPSYRRGQVLRSMEPLPVSLGGEDSQPIAELLERRATHVATVSTVGRACIASSAPPATAVSASCRARAWSGWACRAATWS